MKILRENSKCIICSLGYFIGIIMLFTYWCTVNFVNKVENSKNVAILLCVIIGILITILFGLQLYLKLKNGEMAPQNYFVVAMIIWGGIYMLILPPFSAPDEIAHFASANKLANVIMHKEILDDEQNIYVRIEDYHSYIKNPTEESITNYYANVTKTPNLSKEYVPLDCEGGRGANGFFINYLPQSLGIVIARIFNMNYVFLSLMGRLCNLLFYTIMVYWSIKLIPFGKWALYIASQFPMMLELSSSYSYDVMANALAFIFIAWCMNLIYEKKIIKKVDLLILFILGMIMSPVKAVYGLVTLLVFLLPKNKFPGGKKRYYWIYNVGMVFFSLITILVVNAVQVKDMVKNTIQQPDMEYSVSENSKIQNMIEETTTENQIANYTLKNVLDSPQLLIDLTKNTLNERGMFYIRTLVGGHLGWLDIRIHNGIISMFLLLFVASLLQKTTRIYEISIFHRIWALLIFGSCFTAFHIIMLVSWTPNNVSAIQGVQGRYFLPALPMLFIVCYNKIVKGNVYVPKMIWVYTCNLLNVLTIMQVLTVVYSR